jgi:hypothetical protein
MCIRDRDFGFFGFIKLDDLSLLGYWSWGDSARLAFFAASSEK